jgi:Mitochondrial carrier protein.
VHPVDVVKTIVQHSAAEWQDVVADIYEGQGFEGFWEGLFPRMGRAAVNHAVTFAVYDFIVHKI